MRRFALFMNAAVCGALAAGTFGGQLGLVLAAAVAVPFIVALLALAVADVVWPLYVAAAVNSLVMGSVLLLVPFVFDLGIIVVVPALAFGAVPPALNVFALLRQVWHLRRTGARRAPQ